MRPAGVNAVIEPKDRVALLTQVISALIGAGQYDQARTVTRQAEDAARSITGAHQKTAAVTGLAPLLMAVREYDRAVALADILNEADRKVALGHVARAAAAIGDYDHAEAVVGLIESTYEQAKVLTDLTSILADAGEHHRAEALARSIPDQRRQMQAVIALAHKTNQPHARALVAWALRNGTWSEPLTALANIQPDALLAAADRLIQNTATTTDQRNA